MILVFGIGYLSGTIGALGVGFIVSSFETNYEYRFDNGVVCKESSLGNALTDGRGTLIEIYKTIPWFPIIEWKVQEKIYDNLFIIYPNRITVDYKEEENKMYLFGTRLLIGGGGKTEYWADTIIIKK